MVRLRSSPTLFYFTQIFYLSVVRLVVIRLYFGSSYLITELPFGTPLFVSHCDISLIPRTPDRLMKAYTKVSLPVIKLNVSSPEGDDNNAAR